MRWGILGAGGKTAFTMFQKLNELLSDPVIWGNLLFTIIKIAAIFAAGRIIIKIAHKALTHMIVERERNPLKLDHRRTKTIGKLLKNIVSYTVNFLVLLLVLTQLGIDLGPILAGAGVLGLAIGFGAQSLVKDVITGFFIIFEDQFAVGDVVQTGNFKGTVEEIGLRVTRLRAWTGEVHIIPNGSIQQVTNFSIYNSIAIVDISIAYEENIDHAVEVMKHTVKEQYERMEELTNLPEVLGIQSIEASDVVVRIIAECRPNSQAVVERALKKAVKTALDQNGIEIPYPKLVSLVRTEKAE